LLDRTQPDPSLNAEAASQALVLDNVAIESPPVASWRPLGWLRRAGQFFFALSFSSLTRRIVSLNLAGLVALVASVLYLSQFRAGLIDARAQSLLVQAEIIAGAIAASATVQTNTITIDPDRLLDLKPGETYGAPDEYSGLDFPINPERVAPVLRTLISPTKTRARIYDPNGGLILDSRNLENVLRFERDFPQAQIILLEQNYRSTQTILDAAQNVVRQLQVGTLPSTKSERRSPPGLRFFATDSAEKFRKMGTRFLGLPVEDVVHVDLKE